LQSVTLAGLSEAAVRLLQPQGMICVAPGEPGMPRLQVRLATPLGPVTLPTR
jgi:hypothetical protein